MNCKGIFSIILMLFLIILTLETTKMQKEVSTQSKISTNFLMEMEKASFARSQLETNFDFLIKHSIEFWAKESLDSEFLKEKTSKEIERFVIETKNIYPNIEFFLSNKNTNEQLEFSKEKISELFKIHLEFVENLYKAEFSFDGGIEKDTFFGATIEFDNFSNNFLITSGYNIKVFGITFGG